jgi:hypothetical protein
MLTVVFATTTLIAAMGWYRAQLRTRTHQARADVAVAALAAHGCQPLDTHLDGASETCELCGTTWVAGPLVVDVFEFDGQLLSATAQEWDLATPSN